MIAMMQCAMKNYLEYHRVFHLLRIHTHSYDDPRWSMEPWPTQPLKTLTGIASTESKEGSNVKMIHFLSCTVICAILKLGLQGRAMLPCAPLGSPLRKLSLLAHLRTTGADSEDDLCGASELVDAGHHTPIQPQLGALFCRRLKVLRSQLLHRLQTTCRRGRGMSVGC